MFSNLLKQLVIFRAIVEKGTFSEAAKHTNKSVSAVSYTITNLEDQLQLQLFDRSHYRPKLTNAGQVLYDDADALLRRAHRLEARLGLLRSNGKSHIRISSDVAFPRTVLVDALSELGIQFPEVSVSIVHDDWSQVVEDVRSLQSDLGLTQVESNLNWRGIDAKQIGSSRHAIVVSPSHPLAQIDAPFEFSLLEEYRQIHLSHSPPSPQKDGYKLHKTDLWTVPDDETLRLLLVKGAGWAYANQHVVAQDLRDGTLVVPNCKGVRENSLNRFALIWPISVSPCGPMKRFSDLLQDKFPSAYPEGFHSQFEQWRK